MAIESLDWITPAGLIVPLVPSGGVLNRESGTVGRFMPPVQFIEREVAIGSRLKKVKMGPKEISIPFNLHSPNAVTGAAAVRNWARDLAKHFNPLRGTGIGKLRYYSPSGDVRIINCSYAGGMDSIADTGDGMIMRMVVIFRAHDPIWYPETPTVVTFTGGTAQPFFPIFPVLLSQSQIYSDITINNPGDVDAWPIWKITGPTSNVEHIFLRNLTTGKVIDLNSSVGLGSLVTINTKPGFKTVDFYGANWYSLLSAGTELWPLVPGDNIVRLEISGSTAATTATLEYSPGYLTP